MVPPLRQGASGHTAGRRMGRGGGTARAAKMQTTSERSAYLVLGMHRSGTSATAQLLALARRIQADIQARFAVALEIEPNIL